MHQLQKILLFYTVKELPFLYIDYSIFTVYTQVYSTFFSILHLTFHLQWWWGRCGDTGTFRHCLESLRCLPLCIWKEPVHIGISPMKKMNGGFIPQNYSRMFRRVFRNIKLLLVCNLFSNSRETQYWSIHYFQECSVIDPRYLDALIQEGVPYFKQYAGRQTLNEQHQEPFNSDEWYVYV